MRDDTPRKERPIKFANLADTTTTERCDTLRPKKWRSDATDEIAAAPRQCLPTNFPTDVPNPGSEPSP
jgi:hypothetical protein